MNYTLIKKQDKAYVECLSGMAPIGSEREALDLVAICGEHRADRLMLHAEHLPLEFFDLKTGLAGKVLLVFSKYHLKVVAVVTPELVGHGRFAEMAMESNHFNEFGFFYNRQQAELWLERN